MDAFRWDEGVIRIEPTQYFDVKSEHSIGDVPVDHRDHVDHAPLLCQSAIEFRDRSTESAAQRCDVRGLPRAEGLRASERLVRNKGVTARKPIHELRKEFGSMVNRKHGLTAAKDLLRHADIAITAAHYIDRRDKRQAAWLTACD